MRTPKLLFALLAVFPSTSLLVSRPAAAVELTGQVRGVASDPDGLPVPGVVLNLSSPSMQGGRSAESDAEGAFRFVALPPGEYRVEALKAGFGTTAVMVRVVAGETSSVDMSMSLQVAGEEVVVTEQKPTVDVTSVRSGVVMTKEMMRDIPNAGRDYQGATNFAPGVVDNGSGNPNVRGALSYGNQYYVDGVNTTDPTTNTFSMNMNFDAIEEVQVITGGMDAEYGRAMGGAVNIVTRSGGNEYEGDAQLLYSSTATQVYRPLPEEEGQPEPEQADQSLAVNFGGPILKDKLWFFTSAQLNYSVSTEAVPEDVKRPAEYPMQSAIWKSVYLFGKVTWTPAANHRLWLHAQADPTDLENYFADVYTLPNADVWWQQGGWLGSLGHQWTPDAKTVVDTQLMTSSSYIRYRPIGWKDGCTGYDADGYCENAGEIATDESWVAYDPDGFSYGSRTDTYYTTRRRHSLNSAITRFFDVLGTHQAKTGVQLDLTSSAQSSPGSTIGTEYWTHGGDPSDLDSYEPAEIERYTTDLESELGGVLGAWYLQDVWQPWEPLTLRPGVRVDTSRFLNNKGNPVFESTEVAPRLGAAWDVGGNGKTSLHAFYGRFYDSGFLELAELLSKSGGSVGNYTWDAEAGAYAEEPYLSYSSEFLSSPDFVTPRSDEWDVGLSRDLGDGWGLDLTGTYKVSRNLFEDDEVNLIWDEYGETVIGSRDGTGEGYFRVRTPDDAFIQYTSVELAAERQFDDHWGALGSYTWSRAWGRVRDDLSYGSASGAYDVPEQQDYEVGLMPFDIPHAVKLAGSYRDAHAVDLAEKTALGWLVGWNLNVASGMPYRPGYDNTSLGEIYRESIDGDYRLPAFAQTDLKVGATLYQGRTTWDVTAECFNVFNDRTVTGVQTTAFDAGGTPEQDQDGNLLFGQVTSRQDPRYFQFGLRGEF